MALALQRLGGTPFQATAATALRKLIAAMHADDAAAARSLAARVHLVGAQAAAPMPRLVADALSERRVLRIRYDDRSGAVTEREIEPLAYVGSATHWYLVAWCRLRRSVRAFPTARVADVRVTPERPPPRELATAELDIPAELLQRLSL